MNKVLVFILLIIMFHAGYSQYKPEKGNIGATVGIDGLAGALNTKVSSTNSLLFKYYFTEKITIRAAFNYTPTIEELFIDSTSVVPNGMGIANGNGFTKYHEKISQKQFDIELGVQYNLHGTERIEPYFGCAFIYGIGGKRITEQRTDWLKTEPGVRPEGDFDYIKFEQNMGNNLGIKGFLGVNVFVLKNVAIGAEFGYGYFTNKLSGGTITKQNKINGTTSSNSYKLNIYEDTENKLNTTGGLITISFFL